MLPFIAFIMLLRPLMPVVEYFVAYDYIIQEFCVNTDKPEMECDGTCYLSEQIAKEMGNNIDNPFQQKQVRSELPQFIEDLPEYNLFVGTAITKANKAYQNLFYQSLFVFKTIEPPRVV